MKRLLIKPDGWPCTLAECPAGHFIFESDGDKILGFKSDYPRDGAQTDAYNAGGEFIRIGDDEIVQPVFQEWEEI